MNYTVFIINKENVNDVNDVVLVSLFITLKKYPTFFLCLEKADLE